MISFHNPNFYEKIIKKYGRRNRKSYFPNLFFKQDFKSSVLGNTCIFLSIKPNFYNNLLRKNFSLSSHKEKQSGYPVFLQEFKFSGLNPPEPVINHKIKTYSLQSSNLRLFDTAALNHTYFNNSFANPTSPNLKFFLLNFFENYSRMSFIKIGDRLIRSGFKILRNCRDFFSRENSLFFLHSRLPTENEITFQKVPSSADYSALPLIHTLAASDFLRNIRNEALRKTEYLKFSGRTRTDSARILHMNFIPSVRFLKNFQEKNAFFLIWKYLAGSESDKTGRNTTHERQKVVFLEPSVNIFKQQIGIIARPGAGTYEKIFPTSVMKQIRSLQTVLKWSPFFNLRSNSVNQKVQPFNWLTALTYNTTGISQLNRQGTSNAGSTVAYQFNPQKSYKPENTVFVPYSHNMIQPMREALDYVRIYKFSSAFRYLEFPKLASEFIHMTSNMTVDYRLSDSYVAFYHITQNQKFDSKRGLKKIKIYHFEITRSQSILHHRLFLKSPGMTVSRVKSPEAILCSSGKNSLQRTRSNEGSLTHPSVLTIAASSFSRKSRNELLRKVEKLKLSSYGVLIKGVSARKLHSRITGYKTFDKLLDILIGPYHPQNLDKNGILSTDSASSGSASIFHDKKSKYITNFYENISKEKIHLCGKFLPQKIFELLKLPVLLRTASITDVENKVYSWRIQETQEAYNISLFYAPEQSNYRLSEHQIVDQYTVSSQKVENKKELKIKKRYLVQIKRLKSKLIQPFFVKSLETITYRLKRAKSLLYNDIQIFTPSDTSIPIRGSQNARIYSPLKNLSLSSILSISSRTDKHQDTTALSYPTTGSQKYPENRAFNYKKTYPFEYSTTLIRKLKVSTINSGLSYSFLKKANPHLFSGRAFLSRNILRLFKIIYYPSGTNASTDIEYFITFSNKQNFVSKGTFSSNSLFPGISSNASAPLLSEINGIAFGKKSIPSFNLMKHAGSIIFQSSVFAEKPASSSNKKARSSNAGAQGRKITFLSPRIVQRISSDFVLSTTPDLIAEIKWKKVFSSINGPDKKPEDKKAVSKNIFFRLRDLQSFKNSSKFSIDPESRNTSFALLSLKRETCTIPDTDAFRTSRKEPSELMHPEGSIHKIGREDLVYETSEPLLEEVKRIKRIIFETRAIVADHLESYMPQVTGKPEQVMDIEDMAEKIMQVINHRLKIEAERRGIF